jgi:hypothetical protein
VLFSCYPFVGYINSDRILSILDDRIDAYGARSLGRAG